MRRRQSLALQRGGRGGVFGRMVFRQDAAVVPDGGRCDRGVGYGHHHADKRDGCRAAQKIPSGAGRSRVRRDSRATRRPRVLVRGECVAAATSSLSRLERPASRRSSARQYSRAIAARQGRMGQAHRELKLLRKVKAVAHYPLPHRIGPQRHGPLIFSVESVPIVTAFCAGWLIVITRNDGERGISHASLNSLRDHYFGCDWAWRLLGAPRKSRGGRAVEARLAKTTG